MQSPASYGSRRRRDKSPQGSVGVVRSNSRCPRPSKTIPALAFREAARSFPREKLQLAYSVAPAFSSPPLSLLLLSSVAPQDSCSDPLVQPCDGWEEPHSNRHPQCSRLGCVSSSPRLAQFPVPIRTCRPRLRAYSRGCSTRIPPPPAPRWV